MSLLENGRFVSYNLLISIVWIGHSCWTDSYFFTGDDVPPCDSYELPLTVKHILVECSSLRVIHEKYFTVNSVKQIFDSVTNRSIIDFIDFIKKN